MKRDIDISPRKKQLKEEYEQLQKVYAELVIRREEMLLDEKPRLEAMYMDAVGDLLYEELCLKYEIALLKLQRDCIQAYMNRGEGPDMEAVKEQVEQAAHTYNENLHQEEERIKNAREFMESHEEENSEQKLKDYMDLKRLYRKLVHRLHPPSPPRKRFNLYTHLVLL